MRSTLRPTVPSGIVDSMLSATVGAWTTMNTATVNYWFGALSRCATPFDLARDISTWKAEIADRQRPPWAHEHRIVKEWPIARLRDYSAADADPAMIATVILPPQAGHDSSIVDFAEGQSQIITGRESGCDRIYTLDWVGATQETKDTDIDDYMALIRETVDLLGGKINLVGDCQGGWLATIFTALYPEKVNSLALAGAPIDFQAGEPLINDWLKFLAPDGDMSFYRSAVESNNGVLPGRFLLDGFKTMQPDQELARNLALLTNLHDPQHVERYRKFENWFQWTQALPGAFYLWVVEHLFIRNSLIKGELVVEGRKVDLSAIECPIFLMAGQTDHITPADQVWALADYASTPTERIGRQSSVSGHLGLFMSREALRNHWPVIFKEMAALSTPAPDVVPDVLTDEPTQSQPTVWLPTQEETPEAPGKGQAKAPERDADSTPADQAATKGTRQETAQKAAAPDKTQAPQAKAPARDTGKDASKTAAAASTTEASPKKASTARTPRKSSGTQKSTSATSSGEKNTPARKTSTTSAADSSKPSTTSASTEKSSAPQSQSSTRSGTAKQDAADNSATGARPKTDSAADESTSAKK